MVESTKKKLLSLPRGLCSVGDCFHGATDLQAAEHGKTVGKTAGKKPGVWKAAMPYIYYNCNRAVPEKGRKRIKSFYNWYYTSYTVAQTIASIGLVYIQHLVGWVLGYVILTLLMASSIGLFFLGSRIYVHVSPNGSAFTSILQVIIAAYRKRNLLLPIDQVADGVFYDPPVADVEPVVVTRLPRTEKYR